MNTTPNDLIGTDLAQHPGAITPWAWDGSRLTDEQVQSFNENGFLVGIPVFTKDEISKIREAIIAITDPEHLGNQFWYEYSSDLAQTGGMLHGIGGWRVRPELHDIIWHPKIVAIAEQLLAGDSRLLFDQLFCKPPRQEGLVSWHQDYSYWTYSQPMQHLTCWIALDDADLSNGCVQYVPGSHKWGVLLPRPDKLTREQDSIKRHLTEEQLGAFSPVAAEVAAGQVLFHHPLTLHGSSPNSSDRPRRGTTIHYVKDGTRAVIDDPTVDGVPAWLLGGAGPQYPLTDTPSGPLHSDPYFPMISKQ